MSSEGGQHVRADASAVVHVVGSGELDAASRDFSRDLGDAVDGGARHVVVDLLDVTFIDSSVVRDLVLAHNRVTQRDGWVRLVYTHHLITRVLQICGLAEVFPQYPTVSAALTRGPRVSSAADQADGSSQGGAS